jgi:hypothetical protein
MRDSFFRLGLTAGAVWAAMALFLSIVPSYTERLLATRDLALVAAIAALALLASFAAQAVIERRKGSHGRDQALGCILLALGLAGVVAAFIACIYFLVASFVVASGLLGSLFSLDVAVEAVGSALIAVALGAAAWHAATPRAAAPRRRGAAPRSAAARR